MNRNDAFRAMQSEMVTMATKVAHKHGFDPTEIQVSINMRLPPENKLIEVTLTKNPLSQPAAEEVR